MRRRRRRKESSPSSNNARHLNRERIRKGTNTRSHRKGKKVQRPRGGRGRKKEEIQGIRAPSTNTGRRWFPKSI